MPTDLRDLPEIAALDRGRDRIRIPPEMDIPVTDRVLKLIETSPFRRLQRLSQLGLVAQVYPGATHSRFQHSLGVYRMALLYLKSLGEDDGFRSLVSIDQARLFVAASLLHDIGHWPFCHPIEDLQLPGVPRHEALARSLILESEVADTLRKDWDLDPDEVADFLAPKSPKTSTILKSMLSGPIDVDKLDYLDRDSLHAGVPYGRNFDRQRLINSLCVGSCKDRLAVTDKGRTAAEMMVFARYVMFSEVYWHHAVRSATAMIQRAIYSIEDHASQMLTWSRMDDSAMIQSLTQRLENSPALALIDGLFGPRRRLYKRLGQYNFNQQPELHAALARRPYDFLVRCSKHLAMRMGKAFHAKVEPFEVLIDAPPVKLEVQFNIEVRQSDGSFLQLAEVSPVVRALALQQFDDVVKKVRIFVAPHWIERAQRLPIQEMLLLSVQEIEGESS